MIYIESDRLIIREMQVDDFDSIHAYASLEDILIYEVWGPNSESDTRDFIKLAKTTQEDSPRTTFELVVEQKATKKVIGGFGLRILKGNKLKANFGYIIHPDYWNNGFATEACKLGTQYLSKRYGIQTFVATCDVGNLASKRVLEKCGMHLIKRLDQHIRMKGRLRDTFYFEKHV
jgi:RimJ/RimL family protein N-acetyltransferase